MLTVFYIQAPQHLHFVKDIGILNCNIKGSQTVALAGEYVAHNWCTIEL